MRFMVSLCMLRDRWHAPKVPKGVTNGVHPFGVPNIAFQAVVGCFV